MALSNSEINFLKNDTGIVDLWLSKIVELPVLHIIILHVVGVPAALLPSELHFSAQELSVTSVGAKLKDGIIYTKLVHLSPSRIYVRHYATIRMYYVGEQEVRSLAAAVRRLDGSQMSE